MHDTDKANLYWMALALQYPHKQKYDELKNVRVPDTLAKQMWPMWAITDIQIVDMSLQKVLLSLDGLIWLSMCELYPTTRDEQWFRYFDEVLEALRTRAYFLVAHAPISSLILNVEEDYTEEYVDTTVKKSVHITGVSEEDYYSDGERKRTIKRQRLAKEDDINEQWAKFTSTVAEEAKEEEEEGSVAVTGVVETMRKATRRLVHDLRWMFWELDMGRQQSRIVAEKGVLDVNLSVLRQYLVSQFDAVEGNVLKSRANWQDKLQCVRCYQEIYKRKKRRNKVNPQEVVVNKLHQKMHLDIPKKIADMFLPVSTTDVHKNDRWLHRNTDFMFEYVSRQSLDKGDVFTYLIDREVMERVPITGKWLLHLQDHPTRWYESFTHAFVGMRIVQREERMDPVVYAFAPERHRLPPPIDLSQYDPYLF
jgi:hypothetical protein